MGETPSLTEDEFKQWHTPRAVLDMMGGASNSASRGAIGRRILDGGIKAVAGEIRKPGDGLERQLLGLHLWADWEATEDSDFWSYGETTRYVGDVQVNMYDVRLEPEGVAKLLRQTGRADRPERTPENPFGLSEKTLALAEKTGASLNRQSAVPPNTGAPWQMPIQPAPLIDNLGPHGPALLTAPIGQEIVPADASPHPGGRPRKEFWEPLLIAAGIAIYAGWTPKKIAEVERWMADWLSTNGHDAGEVAVRTRARALFNAYIAERDKN